MYDGWKVPTVVFTGRFTTRKILQSVSYLQLSGVCLAEPAGSAAAHDEADKGHRLELTSQTS